MNWQESTSPNGFLLAEVISAVIKEIRHGKEEESLAWALEMALSGAEAEDFLWECLLVFSIEDVGLADPQALRVCFDSQELYFLLPRGDSRRLLAIAHAVAYLCRTKKTRYANELLAVVKARLGDGSMALSMPDRAVDIHTRRGKEQGRGLLHYYTEAATLVNEDPSFPDNYREELTERARGS